MAALWKFYVYEVCNAAGEAIYVGKGSGVRDKQSCRERGGASVRRVASFWRERDAYAYECERIKEVAPELNKHPGGNGSKATPQRRPAPCNDAWTKHFRAVGSRAYAAQLVLAYMPNSSKRDELRSVAYG